MPTRTISICNTLAGAFADKSVVAKVPQFCQCCKAWEFSHLFPRGLALTSAIITIPCGLIEILAA